MSYATAEPLFCNYPLPTEGSGSYCIHILSDIWGRLSALPKMGNKGSGKETLIWNNLAAAYQIRSFPPSLPSPSSESAARKWNGKSPSIATNNSAMMTKFGGILGQIWMSVCMNECDPSFFESHYSAICRSSLSLWWTTESKLKLFSLIWASIPSPNGASLIWCP